MLGFCNQKAVVNRLYSNGKSNNINRSTSNNILFLVKEDDNDNNSNDIEVDKEEWENLQSDIASLNKTINAMLMVSSGAGNGGGRNIDSDNSSAATRHNTHQFTEMIF